VAAAAGNCRSQDNHWFCYRDIVFTFLPGVEIEDAKSAVGDIVPGLCKDIANYPSLPQLEAAFRKGLRRDISSLQRKSLAKKRGSGNIDVTSELHGLSQADTPINQASYEDEDNAPPSIEGKVNQEYVGWSAHNNVGASVIANRRDQTAMMSEALNELEPDERKLIELSFIGGLKQREIGERLGIGTSSVGVRINRAKAKLKKLVGEKILGEKKSLL
jgi:RNA polymerase sigma factor (sigma-70 family)